MSLKLFLKIIWVTSFLSLVNSRIVKKSGFSISRSKDVAKSEESIREGIKSALRNGEDCWITLDSQKHFTDMESLDATYEKPRKLYPKEVMKETAKFDNDTIELMLASRARREGKGAIYEEIPAGLNLGGYCMIRLPKSLLFFHRVKLRNMTRFIIYDLKTDFETMTLKADLNLRDLHLMGSYERAIEGNDLAELVYVPTFGMAEILLKNVSYTMEGRLRFLKENPYIVLVTSTLKFDRALLMYRNNGSGSECDKFIELTYDSIEEFIDRMKADLDSWLRDFFNHLLIFFKPSQTPSSTQYLDYQKKRTINLNEYVENAIKFLKRRIHDVNATVVKLPNFNILGIKGLEIKMWNGLLRGLDSIYRRSVATGTKIGKVRTVDAGVGFSNLKVVYKYTMNLATDVPPLNGQFILSADEMGANMYITLVKDVASVDVNFDSIQEQQQELLTVDGPANRLISNYKHVLEQHVISLMTNTLLHNIRLLRTLASCEPAYVGYSYDDNDLNGDGNGGPTGDYIVNKVDSVELELNPDEKGKSSKYHMKLQESLRIKKIN